MPQQLQSRPEAITRLLQESVRITLGSSGHPAGLPGLSNPSSPLPLVEFVASRRPGCTWLIGKPRLLKHPASDAAQTCYFRSPQHTNPTGVRAAVDASPKLAQLIEIVTPRSPHGIVQVKLPANVDIDLYIWHVTD